MKTFPGRWLVVPILVAVAVTFGLALVLGLLQVGDRVPPEGYGVAAGLSVAVYYTVQFRLAWTHNVTKTKTVNRGNARAQDGGLAATFHKPKGPITIYNNVPPPNLQAPKEKALLAKAPLTSTPAPTASAASETAPTHNVPPTPEDAKRLLVVLRTAVRNEHDHAEYEQAWRRTGGCPHRPSWVGAARTGRELWAYLRTYKGETGQLRRDRDFLIDQTVLPWVQHVEKGECAPTPTVRT